jgi:hypothetical protein
MDNLNKVSPQKKKELFELLVEYYSLKPEDKWCTGKANGPGGTHCAYGFINSDFVAIGYKSVAEVIYLCLYESLGISLVNDGLYYKHLSSPKERVISYLEDEISKLS